MSFFPAKLKARELICWHIEREQPPDHAHRHCHEYNFAGKVSIIPRIKATVTKFYLELATADGLIRIEALQPYALSKILPDEPISETYLFQVRLSNEIKVPLQGYVILEFKRGKAKSKVNIKCDDEYRLPIGGYEL